MKPSEILHIINEIENFVLQIRKESMGIKGVSPDNHTHIISKPDGWTDGFIKHDKGTCSVYFARDYFSIDMEYNGFPFRASVSGERVLFDNLSIANYITNGADYKELWKLASNINLMSLAERQVQSLKAEILVNNRKTKGLKVRIKELETKYNLNS